MAHKFYELKIWQEGYALLMEIYDIASHFPTEERFALVSQIIRAANSIIANIAESHGRYHFTDKIRILYIARAELEETQSHLKVALGRNYIDEHKFSFLINRYEGLKVGVNKYINYLSKNR
ncbi:four helix bundle protein [Candidatus Falkowbacteria bacterium]|nr:four helix bundle protein [Candidatus Falkowbacteria bacterium]